MAKQQSKRWHPSVRIRRWASLHPWFIVLFEGFYISQVVQAAGVSAIFSCVTFKVAGPKIGQRYFKSIYTKSPKLFLASKSSYPSQTLGALSKVESFQSEDLVVLCWGSQSVLSRIDPLQPFKNPTIWEVQKFHVNLQIPSWGFFGHFRKQRT